MPDHPCFKAETVFGTQVPRLETALGEGREAAETADFGFEFATLLVPVLFRRAEIGFLRVDLRLATQQLAGVSFHLLLTAVEPLA